MVFLVPESPPQPACLPNSIRVASTLKAIACRSALSSGAVWPGEQPLEEERLQIGLNVRKQCLLAASFANEGFTPVLDYVVVNGARVSEYRQQLPGFVLRLVTLVPGVQVALARDQQRPEKTVAPLWAHLDAQIRTALRGVGLWVDNSRLTVAETVAHILLHREEAQV
jgi:hypothetical protein